MIPQLGHPFADQYAKYQAQYFRPKLLPALNTGVAQPTYAAPANPLAAPAPRPTYAPTAAPTYSAPRPPTPRPGGTKPPVPMIPRPGSTGATATRGAPTQPQPATTPTYAPTASPNWLPPGLRQNWNQMPYFAQSVLSSLGSWNAVQSAVTAATQGQGPLADYYKQYLQARAQGTLGPTWTPTNAAGTGTTAQPSAGGAYYGSSYYSPASGGYSSSAAQATKVPRAVYAPFGYGGRLTI